MRLVVLLLLCACSVEIEKKPRMVEMTGTVDLEIGSQEKWVLSLVGSNNENTFKVYELKRGKHTIVIVEDRGGYGVSVVYVPE